MYLIHGNQYANLNCHEALNALLANLPATLAHGISTDTVLDCAASFAVELPKLCDTLQLNIAACVELAAFCSRDALATKLRRELGESPFSLRRIDYRLDHFEVWRPLGLVVHVTPSNASLLPFCAMLESLLVGNVNWLRPSSSDGGLTTRLMSAFLSHDSSDTIKQFIAVLPVSTAELPLLVAQADGVSAWGSDAALDAIHQQLPAGCRWIDWSHRISFAYLTPDAATETTLNAIADDVCRYNQQACSSPQLLLVDSDTPDMLRTIGEQLATAMSRRAPEWQPVTPDEQESADIAASTAFARLDQVFADQLGHVWEGYGWRIIWSNEEAIAPSSLFRTIILRPARRANLVAMLRPWRNRLQSCGLAAAETDLAPLSQLLLAAGVSRITPLGSMHDCYNGEPHDGVQALARLARRSSVTIPANTLRGHATLDTPPSAPTGLDCVTPMNKAAFQNGSIQASAQLFFRSGGSSGPPKLAGFTYRDYHRQMQAAADGLLAAGIEPAKDRVLNLMYAGNLYGGLLSFFTLLDKLGVPHYPMGAPSSDDYSEITRVIIDQRIDTLIGMPSTIYQLFYREADTLRAYGGICKLMLGGEHLAPAQRAFLTSFGIQTIRSAIYGSVDAGPLGHACLASEDSVFHLITDTQWLEIVAQDSDTPAAPGEPGRMLFTSRTREGQRVVRYEIGDLGRWVPGNCICGLLSPRFKLLGRYDQLVRIGTMFIQPTRLATLTELPVQFHFDHRPDGRERVLVYVDGDTGAAETRLLQDSELGQAVQDGLLCLDVIPRSTANFERSVQSGKTPLFIDKRLATV
ncbi:preprotein translocase subunit Tim44 [Burkholderia lata]|uniref:aldehyde dehydrogenase family protein n=1 Tax=Burkholderia lata (strain ATCC 17760 / DSM 23089 / LMG 22485 / NCIMB 9086 / R18194 / 383) TaxID=482957 RepID=UPI001453FC35|nr:acyl-CoA reductase [Burkholderia lata]VWD64816.1 preprotein translocase subunit Tim44 [Burkholderia lata]